MVYLQAVGIAAGAVCGYYVIGTLLAAYVFWPAAHAGPPMDVNDGELCRFVGFWPAYLALLAASGTAVFVRRLARRRMQ